MQRKTTNLEKRPQSRRQQDNKMAGVLPGPTDNDKLKQLSARTYKQQGIWFLNGYWSEMGAAEAENVWTYVHRSQELDLQKGKEGSELDEMMAHRFLEVLHETMTVRELRERLTSKTGERPKHISLAHYLIIKYNLDYKVLVNASQGGNERELREAQAKLDQVQAALRESEVKAQEAAVALREAQRSEAEAKKREAEAKASEVEAKAKEADALSREAELRAAQDELEAALAELKAQEDAYNNKKLDLERKSEEGGAVSRNKAKAELAQHLAEDPLPLRKAKITQEAAVRKADKATQIASEARAIASAAAAQAESDARQATAARAAAEQAAIDSARAAEAAEAALEATRQAFAEAEAYLNEIRSRPGSADGALWWMDRELHEAKAYLPTSKGGYSKK